LSTHPTAFLALVGLSVCVSHLLAAPAPDRPLYFEDRQNGSFATRAAGQSVTIQKDRMELDGVTLRFLHPSGSAHLEGSGTPAPSTYITRGLSRSFRAYPQAGIQHLYPGIDVMFYGGQQHLEYDLNLAKGAQADRIRIDIVGARAVRLDEQGNLIVDTRSGELRQFAPRVFQSDRGLRREIAAKYVLLSAHEIGFQLENYNRNTPLTIDPVIVYTKYFGGSASDTGGPVATDSQGNVYVTGSTNSINFPSTNGTKVRLQPPLLAYSNAGQTVTPLPVGTEVAVTAIGGTAGGNVLYVATPDGIFVSGNHGASFVQAAPLIATNGTTPTVQAISVDAIDPSLAYIATTGGLFSMTSAGQYTGQNDSGMAVAGNGMVNVASVQVSTVDHNVLYATTTTPNNFLYTSTDTGATWQQLNPTFPGEAAVSQYSGNSITFTLAPGSSDLYVIDGNGVFFKSTDGGMTWQRLSGQYLLTVKSITIDPNNPSNIYVVDSAGLQRSTDGGATFTTISPSLAPGVYVQAFALDSSTGDLYLATYTQLEVSTDQGATWKVLPPRPNPNVLIGLDNQVFAGVNSNMIPFVVKWSADGSQMLYSTFFGGSFSDSITGIAIDSQGEAIIAGNTASSDFPVTETISAASPALLTSGFVAKLSAGGSQTIYSSIIGASQGVNVNGLAIDSTGAPYITGTTQSPDFPTTAGVPQPKPPTSMCQRPIANPLPPTPNTGINGFVSKLNANGSSLVYSTFLTGSCGSVGQGIAVDATDEAVVVGNTTSPDFPLSANAYQSAFPGGNTASTTYPNPVNFGFVTKLSAAGDQLIASSLIGGGFNNAANAVALDSSGDAYITGSTGGITPGTTPGAYQAQIASNCVPPVNIGPSFGPSGVSDAFVLKLNPAFSSAQYLTYLGGGCYDSGSSIVLEPSGNVWLSGLPSAGLFPLVEPYELTGTGSYFVSELSADFSQLLFSSYSDGANLAEDPSGAIYVSGTSGYSDGVHKNGGNGTVASLVKISPSGTPAAIITSIGAGSNPTAISPAFPPGIAPGELINIAGQNLGPSNTVMSQLDATNQLPFSVSGTSVSFNGYWAPIISVQSDLVVCFAPFEISGSTEVSVNVNGQSSNSVRMLASASAPYILEIINQDGSVNSASHPAPQGSVLTLYVTGLGVTFPLSQDGSVSAPPLPVPVASVSASVNGNQVLPQFVGAADGLVAGITQINLQIPVATYSSNLVGVAINDAAGQIYIGQ
jgi:uncharacterized protein (TIGR03437 family)